MHLNTKTRLYIKKKLEMEAVFKISMSYTNIFSSRRRCRRAQKHFSMSDLL